MGQLSGRRALVTGGARGLGAGMAQALAEAGASVMIGDLLDAAEVADAIGGAHTHLDVTDEASWEAAVAATVERLGGLDMAELGLFESPEAAVGAVVEQTPAGRLGEVSDMADAVVFLASDQARFITGIGLPVDGGMGM